MKRRLSRSCLLLALVLIVLATHTASALTAPRSQAYEGEPPLSSAEVDEDDDLEPDDDVALLSVDSEAIADRRGAVEEHSLPDVDDNEQEQHREMTQADVDMILRQRAAHKPAQRPTFTRTSANEEDDSSSPLSAQRRSSSPAPTHSPEAARRAAKLADVFAEFQLEKQAHGAVDQRADSLYENALDVLAKKRWSVVDPFDVRAAYLNMEEASKLGHRDAQKIVAFSYLFGEFRWSVDEAKKIFDELAQQGSPDAQLGLAFIYATGLGLEHPEPGRAYLYYTMSALGGNPLAQMAVAYRHYAGINAAEDCDSALAWYRRAARLVADRVKLTGTPAIQRIRLPDEAENAAGGSGTLLDTNVFSYYKYLAETGDIQAKLALAQLYLTGGKGVPMDLHEAARYFTIAAEAGNAQAYAHLGRMYLEGTPATPQSNKTALGYFEKAVDKGNMIGQSGLGLMVLNGWGVQSNPTLALKLFTLAADQGSSDGQFHLGQMYYYGIAVEQNYKLATKFFQLASQSGHILALYNLAHMHAAGIGVPRSCPLATEMLKNVAERGRWSERFLDAFSKYQARSMDEAAVRYLLLAEIGYEVAQTNFAYILDEEYASVQLFDAESTPRRALMYWQRSADQEYPLARVKLGDYSYYGLGTDVDYRAAANHYKLAASTHQNAQALFNLAFMHEQGLGVTRDLHLAKRNYDLAAETASEAFFPVALALIKLRLLFMIDYFKESPLATPSLLLLDELLGPHWDLYAMSVLFGIAVILLINYFTRLRQQRPPDDT